MNHIRHSGVGRNPDCARAGLSQARATLHRPCVGSGVGCKNTSTRAAPHWNQAGVSSLIGSILPPEFLNAESLRIRNSVSVFASCPRRQSVHIARSRCVAEAFDKPYIWCKLVGLTQQIVVLGTNQRQHLNKVQTENALSLLWQYGLKGNRLARRSRWHTSSSRMPGMSAALHDL